MKRDDQLKGIGISVFWQGEEYNHIISDIEHNSMRFGIDNAIKRIVDNAIKPWKMQVYVVGTEIRSINGGKIGRWFYFDTAEERVRKMAEIRKEICHEAR